MIKNIVFDFGGVVLKHPANVVEMIIADLFSLREDEAKKIWCKNKPGLMSGKEIMKEFLERLRQELNFPRKTEKLMIDWLENYKEKAENVDWELLGFIQRLKKRYQVFLLTDTLEIHDRYNKTRNIYDKFHQVFKSFQEGYAKPDKKAFLNFFQKTGVKPEECVFIDDLEKNVAAATEVGMKGVVYKNLEQLKKELTESKLI